MRRIRNPPAIVYADAMMTPDLELPMAGALLALPCGIVEYFACNVPHDVVQQFLVSAATCIARAECWAQAASLATWKELIRNNSTIAFCDSTAALGALIHGSSKAGDLNDIAGFVWDLACNWGLVLWWEWVPSHLNVADPISRGNFDMANLLGGRRVAPAATNISFLR